MRHVNPYFYMAQRESLFSVFVFLLVLLLCWCCQKKGGMGEITRFQKKTTRSPRASDRRHISLKVWTLFIYVKGRKGRSVQHPAPHSHFFFLSFSLLYSSSIVYFKGTIFQSFASVCNSSHACDSNQPRIREEGASFRCVAVKLIISFLSLLLFFSSGSLFNCCHWCKSKGSTCVYNSTHTALRVLW